MTIGNTGRARQPLPETVIGLDIGGTYIKGGVVDLAEGALIGPRLEVLTPTPSTPDMVADVVAQMVATLSSRLGGPSTDQPVGITFPAIIQRGIARSAANVDKAWLDTNVDALFSNAVGGPVLVINDADAAGLAEVRYGAGKDGLGTILVITLGTGIGSAFICDGILVPNTELGHVEIEGRAAETRASAVARERDHIGWNEYAERLQRYFSHLEFLFSPELFIVGGGISQRSSEFLPSLKLKTPIIPAQLRNDAGVIGGALQAALTFGA